MKSPVSSQQLTTCSLYLHVSGCVCELLQGNEDPMVSTEQNSSKVNGQVHQHIMGSGRSRTSAQRPDLISDQSLSEGFHRWVGEKLGGLDEGQ